MMWMRVVAILLLCFSVGRSQAGDAVKEKANLSKQVGQWVAARDFERLSRQSDSDLKTQARFSDGLWRLSGLHANFEKHLAQTTRTPEAWKPVLAELRRRAQRKPMDWFFYQDALYALAWQIRGPGFASTVSPVDMERFKELLRQGRDVLDENKAALIGNPLWYSRRVTLALELSEAKADQEALFNEGIQRHPRYHPLYFARLRALSPKWGGSLATTHAFVQQLATLKGEAADEGLLARAIWVAEDELFGHELMRSEAVRQSMEVLLNRYPDPWNVQAMFLLACTGSQKVMAVKLLPKLPADYLSDLGVSDPRAYDLCRQWADGTQGPFIMRRVIDGKVRRAYVD